MPSPQLYNCLSVEISFETLPEELQIMIFSYFSTRELLLTISPVCDYWKSLALKPTLWKKIIFHSEDCFSNSADEIIKHLNRSFLAQQVEFNCVRNFNWSTPLNTFTHIRKLKFIYCNFNLKELSQFVDNCPNIDSFCVHNSGLRMCKLSGNLFFRGLNLAMVEKITELQKLKSLKLSCNHCINEAHECLDAIVHRCKIIEKLNLVKFIPLIERSFKELIELRGPQLKVLKFSTSLLHGSYCKLILQCEKLEKLSLVKAYTMTASDVERLSKLPNLKRLECYSCYSLEKKFLNVFDDINFKKLEDIVLDKIDWSAEIIKKQQVFSENYSL